MKLSLSRRGKAVVVGAMATVLVAGGVATAAWLSNGTGTGSAKAVTAKALTTESVTVTGDLYPGALDKGTLTVRIKNDNDYPVTVTSIKQNGTVTSDKAGCTTTGVSLKDLTVTDVVSAKSSATFAHSNSVSMDNTSDDACQGATFTIPVTLSGVSGVATSTL